MRLLTALFLPFLLIAFSPAGMAAKAPKTQKKMTEHSIQVKFETSLGNFTVQLNKAKAPVTVENFLSYVKEGFYEGTIFHRVIPGFMAQGGGMTADMKQKPNHAPIKIEADNGLPNKRGSIAMARTSDPNSATSQFFVNFIDNAFLNYKSPTTQGWGYTVFGEVTEGMDVIDAMGKIPTGPGDVPKTTITITKATVISE